LFAALEVATGKIIAAHSKRRRRVEDRPASAITSPAASRPLQRDWRADEI
jgi:hypothetical protein